MHQQLVYDWYQMYHTGLYRFALSILKDPHGQFVSWVDYDHNTVFQIYCRDDAPDFAIACAKELIDQMH